MDTVGIGSVQVSRMLLGSNPFSGFSHQGRDRDQEMVRYYTVQRIKDTLYEAERLGLTGIIARTDFHVMRMLMEYRDEGGKLQWFAQTCPEVGSVEMCADRARRVNAVACHIHGGVMDHLVAHGRAAEAQRGIDHIRKHGMLAGVAGHSTRVFEYAEEHLDVDYYMCCYYNPTRRDDNPEHVHGAEETYREEDRRAMTQLIQGLSRPAIHYKVLAAGRNDPAAALAYCRAHMRERDLVCIGVHRGDNPRMLEDDVRYFEQAAPAGPQGPR